MSIPVLTQVYDEVRRLSIAGSMVAGGDFRLKKLVPPLEQAGQKAPVFAKVAQAVNKVVESNDQTSAEALLELSTLVNAILYTQGETGHEGKLEPLETTDLGQQQTQASARVLKPLLEALTSTGSGRMEIIKDAHERGSFRDLRLVKPAIAALDDSYPEIADFVSENILPLYGKAILPELRARFDQKGRGGHVRRLALMHQLDPEGTRQTVKRALDEGSKEIRVVAVECLGGSPEDLVFLLEQAKSKAKDVREAALKALAKSDTGDAVTALRSALTGGDIELAVAPIRGSRNPLVLKFVLEEAAQQRDALLSGNEKDKKAAGKQVARFLSLLECLRGRDDRDSEKFLLQCFAQRAALAAIKAEPSGKDIQQRLVSILAGGSKKAQQILVDAHATLAADEPAEAFLVACHTRPAKEVFDLFSPYLTVKADEKRKKGNPVIAKREAICELLGNRWNWRWAQFDLASRSDEELSNKLDPRWLDVAVQQENMELVQSLARPGHVESAELLAKAFEEWLRKPKSSQDEVGILEALVRSQHPSATDAVVAAIGKRAKQGHAFGFRWMGQLFRQLPKTALTKIEALLPTLSDEIIDQLVDYVNELKKTS